MEAEKEAVIIQVRKKIKLHPRERVNKDYFVRGGQSLGLVPGTQVEVVRRLAVHDPFINSSIGDFFIKVAEVEIIYADHEKSIARLISLDRNAHRPMLQFDSVMVGDRLNLSSLKSREVSQLDPAMEIRQPASVINPRVIEDDTNIIDAPMLPLKEEEIRPLIEEKELLLTQPVI